MIVKRKGKYCLISRKTRRNLGCYRSRAGAEKRERQVQYFKSHPKRREVRVRHHTRRRNAPLRTPRRDPLESEAVREQWDYGTFKYHPLWREGPEEEPELAIRPGDILYRGTSTAITKGGIKGHVGSRIYETPSWMRGQRRIYMSESAEDAAGYGPLTVEQLGGKPVLCEITLTPELFAALRPGYEGAGEWFVDQEVIPASAVRCIPLRVDPETDLPIVPWEKISL